MFPIDIWQKISESLDSDDIFSLSLTCKAANKAFNRKCIQEKISWPLVDSKRLTSDQRNIIRKMENLNINVKLIRGSVGSGKSIVSLAYCLRKGFDKIFIVVPPNLIKMWEKTCKTFFGISPLVIHNSNPKYRAANEINRQDAPEERIILFSYIIFSNNYNWINQRKNDVLIIDEAHHYVGIKYKFKEIVALSATAFKSGNLSHGVRNLIGDSDIKNIIFELEKTVIASKLLPFINVKPYRWKIKDGLKSYIFNRLNPLNDEVNNLNDMKWIPQLLTHTFIPNMENKFLGWRITVGKKRFNICFNRSSNYYFEKNKIEDEYRNKNPWNKKKFDIYCEEKYKPIIEEMLEGCVKYHQCLAILKYLRNRKEKAIIFDINVTYLPFIHKFLTDRGINSYMFTTEYDVASRQRQLEKFKTDKNANVLLSSVEMLGEGHNVTEANHIIFLTNMSYKNKYYQAIGRCWRYPQKLNVYIYNMFNSQLDEEIYKKAYYNSNLMNINWKDALNN